MTVEPARRIDLSRTPLRFFADRPHLGAALVLSGVVLIYLWPALIGGDLFAPISVLYNLMPWHTIRPPGVDAHLNYLLADVPWADYPWRELVRTLLHEGRIPLWNPYVGAGLPLYTNTQSGLFSIFNLPLWIFSLNYGLGVSAALKLCAGAIGTYLFARELRVGFAPGLVAGIAFAFSSLNITWLTIDTLAGVAMVLPWMLWLIERIFRRGEVRSALALAAATAISLGGGHPGTQVQVMVAAGLYVLLRMAFADEADLPARLRPAGLALGGLVLGAMAMGFMLVPEALSGNDTVGTVARKSGLGTLPGTHMPFGMIRTVLFPDWWGRPSAFETANAPEVHLTAVTIQSLNFNERTFYAGVVTCLLAAVALLSGRAWRRKGPLAIMGFVALAIPLHAPGLYWLAEHLPVLDIVQSQRMHFVFELCLAVLAAFGLQALMDQPRERRWLLVPVAAALAAVVALLSIHPSSSDAGHVLRHFLTGADFRVTAVVTLTSVAWFLLFAVGVTSALLAVRRWPERSTAIALALVALTAFDMLHFAHGYNPMAPASQMIPPRMPSVAYLQRHVGGQRIAALELDLSTDWSMVYGLHDVRSYDPPYPTERMYELWRVANPEQVDWNPMNITALSSEAISVLSLLGARYVLADPGVEAPARRTPELRELRRVYSGRDATIFENPRAVPRAYVPSAIGLVAEEVDGRAALSAPGFDPRHAVVLERDQPGAAALASAPAAHGSAVVSQDRGDRVTMHAMLDRRGLVVLDDNLTAGWSVAVDGRPAPVVRVNSVTRGVIVGGGRHRIVWRYAVPGLRAGLAMSVAALLLLGAGGIAVAVRERRLRAGR